MKILTKSISVVAIVALAFCLCILPVSAAPGYSIGGFADNDFLLRPIYFDVAIDDVTGYFRVPVSPGVGSVNLGFVSIDNVPFNTYTSSSQITVQNDDIVSFSARFDSLMLPISDFSSVLGLASVSSLGGFLLTGTFYSIDDSTNRTFDIWGQNNIGVSDVLGNAIFESGYINTYQILEFDSFNISDIQDAISSLGFEYIYIESFILFGSPSESGCHCSFDSPSRSEYYAFFEFPHDVEFIDEQPDLVAWIYDVLQGLFSLQIFGDVTLGTLLLVAISVPLLVSMLKAIAGG